MAGAGRYEQADRLEIEISERTVEFHVGNILAKLGVASRLEAVLWAKENVMVRSRLQFLCIIFIIGVSACGSRSPSELTPSLTTVNPVTSPPTTAQVANRSATLTVDAFDYDYMPWVPAVEIASLSPEGQIERLVILRLQHFEKDQATDCYRILDFGIESIDTSERWTELIDDPSYTAVGLVSFWVRPVQRNCAWPPAGGGKEAVRDGHYVALLSRMYGLRQENEGYGLVDLTQKMTYHSERTRRENTFIRGSIEDDKFTNGNLSSYSKVHPVSQPAELPGNRS